MRYSPSISHVGIPIRLGMKLSHIICSSGANRAPIPATTRWTYYHFILEDRGKSGVGSLELFGGSFRKSFDCRRPNRDFVADPNLFRFGTSNEASEVVVSAGHLDSEV